MFTLTAGLLNLLISYGNDANFFYLRLSWWKAELSISRNCSKPRHTLATSIFRHIMKRRKSYYILSVLISTIGIVLSPLAIVNTMVSLKYETENVNDCVSLVNGQNLCNTILYLKIAFIVCLAILIGLLYFRKRILKTSE